VTDSVDFHDYTIESLLVEAKARRLVLRAFDAHAPSAPCLVAEFSDLAGYCFIGDVLGTIVFELEERDAFELYKQFAHGMQAAYRSSGGHGPWTRSESEAAQFLASGGVRGFELSSSIGAIGGIWCRSFRKWAEPGATA
jgi:hypothetical protein